MKLEKQINIKISKKPISYDLAINKMESYLSLMKSNKEDELIWFLEHDCVFTAGTSAKEEDQNIKNRNLIRYSGRGGQWTWHGKGQRIVYLLLDLNQRERDIKKFIQSLENWIISTLKVFSVNGIVIENNPGVWIKKNKQLYKIASIGIRISKWFTWHGIAINLNPNLDYFKQIVPCGIKNSYVTSLKKEGVNIQLEELDNQLIKNLSKYF